MPQRKKSRTASGHINEENLCNSSADDFARESIISWTGTTSGACPNDAIAAAAINARRVIRPSLNDFRYKPGATPTIENVANANREQLYAAAAGEFGRALERLAAGYEADPDKRHDLLQDIHLHLWKSLEGFDGRCSLKTWTFRVAHNAAVTYVSRERRKNSFLISLEELEQSPYNPAWEPDIDHHRALQRLSQLIRKLKPLDRQIMLLYLEEIDNQTIADITGLSPANVGMKVHRIKLILSRRLAKVEHHA